MSGAQFVIALLNEAHDRSAFTSGTEALDRYFQRQVSQDARRRVATCFVATAPDGKVAGYYTLASSSMILVDLPPESAKKLPRYPLVPAVRMGRLAVDQAFAGQGLGAALLADALVRSARSEIAAFALVVDAKDEKAKSFYEHHGFIGLPDSPLTLFLPLTNVE
jgi:ribosomal protein S18 acetylase RimI-like enzyme